MTAKETQDAATETLAEVLACFESQYVEFCRDRDSDDLGDGYYEGYLSDAAEIQRRLRARGYILTKIAEKK